MTCFNSIRRLIPSTLMIALCMSLCTIFVSAKPLLILSEQSRRCVSVHALDGSKMKVQYESLDNDDSTKMEMDGKYVRNPNDLYYIDVSIVKDDEEHDRNHRPQVIKHHDIIKDNDSFFLDMNGSHDIEICVFSSVHHAIHLDVTFGFETFKYEKKDKNEKLDAQTTALELIKGQIINMKNTLEYIDKYASETEEIESDVYYMFSGTYKKLTWAPFVKLFVLLIIGFAQAKHIIQYLKKQHII